MPAAVCRLQQKAPSRAILIALSIAVQDVPEGLAVALPVYMVSRSGVKGFSIGVVSAAVEYISSFIALIEVVEVPPSARLDL